MSRPSRFRRGAELALGALTTALAAALIWAVLDLYLAGRALRAADLAAVIFSREAVAARLPLPLLLLGLWLAALIAALAARPGKKPRPAAFGAASAPAPPQSRREALLRGALLGLALLLVLLGVLNGGLRDVFIKAANICTECIGLG